MIPPMRFLFRWAWRIFAVLTILAVAGFLLFPSVVKGYAEKRFRKSTGHDIRISKMEAGIVNNRFLMEDVVVYNLAAFGGGPMLKIKELHMEYDLNDEKLKYQLIRADIEEIHYVIDQQGRTNLVEFRDALFPPNPTDQDLGQKVSQKVKDTLLGDVQFDGIVMLNLTVGKLIKQNIQNPAAKLEANVAIENAVMPDIPTLIALKSRLREQVIPAKLDAVLDVYIREGETASSPSFIQQTMEKVKNAF